jgi:hypothetical protein
VLGCAAVDVVVVSVVVVRTRSIGWPCSHPRGLTGVVMGWLGGCGSGAAVMTGDGVLAAGTVGTVAVVVCAGGGAGAVGTAGVVGAVAEPLSVVVPADESVGAVVEVTVGASPTATPAAASAPSTAATAPVRNVRTTRDKRREPIKPRGCGDP